ncbi:MAG: hypothetical protein PHH77_05105 [Victivallaceae bacterium]|nr:hypothetical protein [Victivallaceae bacterium]
MRRLCVSEPAGRCDYETNPRETAWIIAQLRLWAGLVPGFIYLWLVFAGFPWYIALSGGILSAIAPAAVARHTGQMLVKGAFALPFLTAALAFFTLAFKRPGRLPVILVMVAAFGATVFWDASQLVLGIWAGLEILRWIIYGSDERRKQVFTAVYAALVLAAVISPYNRAHYALLSPALLIFWPALAGLHFTRFDARRKRLLAGCSLIAVLALLQTGITYHSRFAENYRHFSSLAKAKLFYLNRKPADPAQLTFEQRFLWTPGLQSATWEITKNLFPYVLWVFLLFGALGFCFKKVRNELLGELPDWFVPGCMTLIFFVFYLFFVRFHVFSALALNAAFPMLVYGWYRAAGKRPLKMLVLAAALGAIISEGVYSLRLHRGYRQAYFRETAALVKWFRQAGTADKVVLADMEISPVLKAYCGAAILIQPKFELAEIRKDMEQYVKRLFHGSERDFADYCAAHEVDFAVFSRGKIAPMEKFSYRYMADAKRIKTKSPAYLMDCRPRSMQFFYEIAPPPEFRILNNRYRVYQVIRPEHRPTARYAADLALEYYYAGRLKLARKAAATAFLLNPKSQRAYLVYYQIFGDIPRPTLADFCKLAQ